jgi:hypothetical protein
VSRHYQRWSVFLPKTDLGAFSYTWEVAGFVFVGLAVVWVAIWVLDFAYYNQLLIGSVSALLELENASATSQTIPQIRLSTLVENAVGSRAKSDLTEMQKFRIAAPRWIFYVLVFAALIAGATVSFYEHLKSHPPVLARPLGERI